MKKVYTWLLWFLGTMIMAWLGNYFYDSTKNVPVLKYITGALNWLYDAVYAALNFQVKVSVVLFVLLLIIGLLWLYQKIKDPSVTEPEFIQYKKDVFKTWIWRWDWKWTGKYWIPTNLTPYCPKDDVQLIENGSFFKQRFYCPKCETQYNEYDEPIETAIEAEVLLLDKVNKKIYTNV